MKLFTLVGLFLAVFLIACGDDGMAGEDAGTDVLAADTAAPDTPESDAGTIDGGGDVAIADATTDAGADCILAPLTFELNATVTFPTDIEAAFDGEQFWVTFTGRVISEDVDFHVYLERFDCEGNRLTPGDLVPVDVNDAPSNSNSVIAIQDDVVIVAWETRPTPSDPQTLVRVFDRLTGTALEDESQLAVLHGDTPAISMREPRVVGVPGGFWLAGLFAVGDAVGYNTFAQRLDATGVPMGTSIEPMFVTDQRHMSPAIAIATDTPHLAWDLANVFVTERQTHYKSPSAAARLVDAAPTISLEPALAIEPGSMVPLITYRDGDGAAYLSALGPVSDTRVTLAADAAAVNIATRMGGGAVSFVRDVTVECRGDLGPVCGTELVALPFTFAGDTLTLGTEVLLPVEGAVPVDFVPSIDHLSGNFYLVTWSDYGEFEIGGRAAVVELAP